MNTYNVMVLQKVCLLLTIIIYTYDIVLTLNNENIYYIHNKKVAHIINTDQSLWWELYRTNDFEYLVIDHLQCDVGTLRITSWTFLLFYNRKRLGLTYTNMLYI